MNKLFKKSYMLICTTFLIFTINLVGGTKVYAENLEPEIINYIQNDKTALIEGKSKTFNISSDYEGKVRYRVWIYSANDKKWTDISNGYGEEVNGKEEYNIITPKLKLDNTAISVWMKKSELNTKEQFDNYKLINLNVLKDPNIPKILDFKIKSPVLFEGENQILTLNSDFKEKVQYRVWLNNKDSNEVIEVSNGYTDGIDGQVPYELSIPNIKEGNYKITVWTKKNGTEGIFSTSTGSYDDSKSIDFACKKDFIEFKEVKLNKDKVYEGSSFDLNVNVKYYDKVQYRIWLYSSATKQWYEQTKGYTQEMSPNDTYKITIPKLQAGSYCLSVWVKRSGTQGKTVTSNGRSYDNYKLLNFNCYSVGPKPLILKSIKVLNESETTRVNIRSGPGMQYSILGYAYGSTAQVKVLEDKNGYSKIETINYVNGNKIIGYVPSRLVKTVQPNKNYSIVIDLSDQRVYVYKNGTIFKKIICSTGMPGFDTPTGVFLVASRGPSFGDGKSYVCYNFVRFNYDFLFHSVLYDLKGNPIESELKKLGKAASHGCIRLPMNESKWIYNNIPRNTVVLIQK